MTPQALPAAPPAIGDALGLHQAGRLVEAETMYRQILETNSRNHDALHLLGVVHIQRGEPQQAIELISEALALSPDDYHALNHLGEAYRAMLYLDEAMTCFERALELKDDLYQAWNNMGNIYQARDKLAQAAACYQKAIAINPEYAEAHINLGNTFQERGMRDAAIAAYRRSLEIHPDSSIALANLGNLYKSMRLYDEAIPLYRRAVALQPHLVDVHLGLARALQESGQREKALRSFERACELAPDNPEARWGFVMSKLPQVHESVATVEDYRNLFAQDIADLDEWFNADRVGTGYSALGTQQPFYLAYHEENNRELLVRYGALCNRLAHHWQIEHKLELRKRRVRSSPVRVGIVSAHFCDHSVWHALLKGWCLNLDPERIELHLFSTGPHDAETDRVAAHVGKLLEGTRKSEHWARSIIDRQIDVLIFPEIGMDPMSSKLANLRLAPVQATTWGHPETSGLPTIDYYLSAEDFEPDNAEHNYSERLIRLPHLSCCYTPLDIPEEDVELATLGINAEEPIFVCPGTPFKYAPRHDPVLVSIAKRLGRAQFLLFKYPLEGIYGPLINRLEVAFAREGLDFHQFVVEIPWLSKSQFNSLLRKSTLYLDTIGFSGFNSAMQAIECGLPVVTREGRFLRGRLASGVLRRIGMRETIAASDDEYVNLVVMLARDPSRVTRLRQQIVASRNVLFDDAAPVRALETFFTSVTVK